MTLVAVRAHFQIGACQDKKMLHGLAYHTLIDTPLKLKTYCRELCDKYIQTHLIPQADPDDQITFSMEEFGVVVPDAISLPDTDCDTQKAAMANMTMVIEPLTPLSESEKGDDYPDIVEVVL